MYDKAISLRVIYKAYFKKGSDIGLYRYNFKLSRKASGSDFNVWNS